MRRLKSKQTKISRKIAWGLLVKRYGGQWVAFSGEKIVGNGKTLKSLMKKMKKKGMEKKVSVFLVPKEKHLVV